MLETRLPVRRAVLAFASLLALGASASAQAAKPPDPSKDEVVLPAAPGWQARLAFAGDVGIWTVGAVKCFEFNGCPELFALDDKGRCRILSNYSARWTPWETVMDHEWLGAFSAVDLDPKDRGVEMYTGGKRGNLFRILAHKEGGFDTALVARFPAEELHTSIGADLLAARPGSELLIFTHLGHVYDIRRDPAAETGYSSRLHATLPGRVRQAVVLPSEGGGDPWIAAVLRSGEVLQLRMTEQGFDTRPVLDEPMGFGRLAVRPTAPGQPLTLYVTRDDGIVLRLERRADASFARETIYAGPQGPRGIAAGRFDADPAVETVAVFGYSTKVQLLSRKGAAEWKVETLFEDTDRGHWLQSVELDGRNATDELVGSGYAGRVFVLARDPGYGLGTVPTEPRPAPATARSDGPPRIGVVSSAKATLDLSPLGYGGGFETKTLLFETLVNQGADGQVAPGLAEAWRVEDGGKSLVLTLRAGAVFHDGTPVDAAAVALHFRRCVGLPEHAWLPGLARVTRVAAVGPREVRFECDRPTALLPELAAINPCSIQAPGAFDRSGRHQTPIGSGPYRMVELGERLLRLERAADAGAGPRELELALYSGSEAGALCDDFIRGAIDGFADGGYEVVPRTRLAELARLPGVEVAVEPGSAAVYVSFRGLGPTSALELRRAIAGAVDRAALIREVELGHADPLEAFAGAALPAPPPARPALAAPLVLVVERGSRDEPIAAIVARQLAAAGIPCGVSALDAGAAAAALDAGAFDLRIERSWGRPYDPHLTLANSFLPKPEPATAATRRAIAVDPEVGALVERMCDLADPAAHRAAVRAVLAAVDQRAVLVPLYVPRRIGVCRPARVRLDLDGDLYHVGVVAPAGAGASARQPAAANSGSR